VSKRGKNVSGFQRYVCNCCKRDFNDITGTVFDKSKLKIREWFYIVKEKMAGRSLYSIASDIKRPYKTVHKAFTKLDRNKEFWIDSMLRYATKTRTDKKIICLADAAAGRR
jgi:transposase-like protein